MPIRISKPPVNIREKLAELERPIGLNGSALMRTETPQEAFSLIGAGRKNLIINGDMQIDQRNNGSSITPTSDGGASSYSVDRWVARLLQPSKFSLQRSTIAPSGFSNSILATSLSSYSVLSTDFFGIAQYIEGLNSYQLNWGTSSAKTVTLSFWVRSSLTGTFGGSLWSYQGGGSPSYPFSYSISSANTWEYKTITIPGPTSGTWVNTNDGNIVVFFSLGAGSSRVGTAGSWINATYASSTNSTSVVGTNGATFYLTGVQFEEGKVATPFEYLNYGDKLALCQRYFQTVYASSGYGGNDSTRAQMSANFFVPMRATPTASLSSPATITDSLNNFTQSSAAFFATYLTTTGGFLHLGNFTGLTVNRPYLLNTNGGYYIFSSEL